MANNFVTMALKGIEFKPSNVLSPADKELRRRLFKLGAFVRRSARQSIRKSKKAVADPGKPPKSKSGHLKNLIVYDVELDDRNVVIGPRVARSKIANFIEYGGEQVIEVWPWWQAADFKERQKIKREIKAKGRRLHDPANKVKITVKYEPRPFMRPAFEKEIRANPDLWGDLI